MNRRLPILSILAAVSLAMSCMAISVLAGSVATVPVSAGLPNTSIVPEAKSSVPAELKNGVKKTTPASRVTLPIIPDAGNLPITEVSADPEPILVQSADAGTKGSIGSGDRSDNQTGLNAAKPSLGDAIISQQTLHIYLDQPASISLYSARGQLVYHLESNRRMEVLPLQGLPTGFLYLTLRAGPYELTKKLVYSGR